MIKLLIGNSRTFIDCSDDIREKISDLLSFSIDGAKFVQASRPMWDGRIRLLKKRKGQYYFPTGLIRVVYRWCAKKGYKIEAKSNRLAPKAVYKFKVNSAFELRDYQAECKEIVKKKNRGVMVLGTGGGKTFLACHIIEQISVPTLFIVPDTGLRRQTFEVFCHNLGRDAVGTDIGSGKPIVVANIQSLVNKKEEDFERFEMMMIDEFHHASSASYLKVNEFCVNAYYRYGLTGTFLRTDGKDMVMHGVLSDVIFHKSTSELIEEGYLVRPWIDIYQFKLSGYSRMNYKRAYESLCQDESLARFVVEKIRDLVMEGLQTLVLVRRVEHGELLSSLLPEAIFLHGGIDANYREDVKKDFNDKKVQLLIATKIFGEGTDIPSIEALVNARFEKTEIETKQGIGRSLRKCKGKEKAKVIDFLITGQRHLNQHSLERIETYKKEPAFKISLK